jgi:hypothetical protein
VDQRRASFTSVLSSISFRILNKSDELPSRLQTPDPIASNPAALA